MSLETLKLSKALQRRMLQLGFHQPTPFQQKAISRIVGGHSFVGIAPQGAGKSTSAILGALSRLKPSADEAPKILVLAPNEQKVQFLVEAFIRHSNNPDLPIMGLKAGGSMEEEIEGLVRGVDIVVATPSRARAVYLKLGLNLNRIQIFILDDAEEIVKQGMQTQVRELAQSCGKVQYIALSTVMHTKLEAMIDDFLGLAPVIEVEEWHVEEMPTLELIRYQVPNFTTKINLLLTLLEDKEVFDKVLLCVNTAHTARTIQEKLDNKKIPCILLDPLTEAAQQQERLQLFARQSLQQVCIMQQTPELSHQWHEITFLFYFELPEESMTFIQQVSHPQVQENIAISFVTDLELPQWKNIEQQIGKKIPETPLPEEVHVFQPSPLKKEKEIEDESRGGAFHPKKESNAKTYNYGGGQKAKMTKANKRKG